MSTMDHLDHLDPDLLIAQGARVIEQRATSVEDLRAIGSILGFVPYAGHVAVAGSSKGKYRPIVHQPIFTRDGRR